MDTRPTARPPQRPPVKLRSEVVYRECQACDATTPQAYPLDRQAEAVMCLLCGGHPRLEPS